MSKSKTKNSEQFYIRDRNLYLNKIGVTYNFNANRPSRFNKATALSLQKMYGGNIYPYENYKHTQNKTVSELYEEYPHVKCTRCGNILKPRDTHFYCEFCKKTISKTRYLKLLEREEV